MMCLTCNVPVDENNMCPVCGMAYIQPYEEPESIRDPQNPIQ
jgi:hypothetical protein